MKKPTLDQVKEYMQERGLVITDQHEAFFDYHESRGWVVGKNKMKDWKAAVRTWIRNSKAWGTRYARDKSSYQSFSDRQREQAAEAFKQLEEMEQQNREISFRAIC